MRAHEVMTSDLVTIPPETPLDAIARLFAERGISGAPVVDADGKLLGLVTESDLMRRIAAPEDRPRGWLRDAFAPAGRQAADYARLHGRVARDVMTTALVTAEADTPIAEIAKVMEERGIRRVPVLREGKLAGLVARADLIRALATPNATGPEAASDERIRRAVLKAMRGQPWVDAFFIFPDVRDGVVSFHGYYRDEAVQRALKVLAEQIPGVREVEVLVERTPLPLAIP
jgi:CBS domain-containing protein